VVTLRNASLRLYQNLVNTAGSRHQESIKGTDTGSDSLTYNACHPLCSDLSFNHVNWRAHRTCFLSYVSVVQMDLTLIAAGMVNMAVSLDGVFIHCALTYLVSRYLPEAAHPYYVLAPHATIEFASPKGANPPLDPASVKAFESDAECVKFLADETVKSKLASTKKLSEVSSKDYDAIFYVGGHGPTIDLPVDEDSIRLATEFYQAGKITGAVCHGPAALVNVKDAQGKSIFAGKAATGFSNEEEIMMDKVKVGTKVSTESRINLAVRMSHSSSKTGSSASVESTRKLLRPMESTSSSTEICTQAKTLRRRAPSPRQSSRR